MPIYTVKMGQVNYLFSSKGVFKALAQILDAIPAQDFGLG